MNRCILSVRQGMDVWKDCVSSVLHILVQIDPASLASVSEMLLEGIQNSGNAVFVRLFGDLLVTSARCNLYIRRSFFLPRLQPWMQSSLQQSIEWIARGVDKENDYCESAFQLTVRSQFFSSTGFARYSA